MNPPLDGRGLAARFESVFGARPDGVWQAPGRVNLIGEHTDYNEGFVLPFAIDRAARVAVRVRPDSTVRMLSTFGNQGLTTADDRLAGPRQCQGLDQVPAGGHLGAAAAGTSRFPAWTCSWIPMFPAAPACPPPTPSNAP